MAESMPVPSSNSSTTMLTFSCETLVMFLTPPVVASADSSALVTLCSICSGLAPAYVV